MICSHDINRDFSVPGKPCCYTKHSIQQILIKQPLPPPTNEGKIMHGPRRAEIWWLMFCFGHVLAVFSGELLISLTKQTPHVQNRADDRSLAEVY